MSHARPSSRTVPPRIATRRLRRRPQVRYRRLHLEMLEDRRLLSVTRIDVNTFGDVLDSADGLTSLREAIIEANTAPGEYEIHLPNGTYDLTIAGTGEDAALTGDLDILANRRVTILGSGASETIIDASGLGDRILDVHPMGVLVVEGVTLTGGRTPTSGDAADRSGGGIRNRSGLVTVADSTISANTANEHGGGVYGTGTVNLRGSSISGNTAGSHGGGVYSTSAVTVINSVISENASSGFSGNGGGIHATGTLMVSTSTISGNSTSFFGDGGGIYTTAIATVTGCTVTGNIANRRGGGIASTGSLSVIDSTIFENGANTDGGGIVSLTFGTLATLSVESSTIAKNTAGAAGASGSGGGIYSSGSTVHVNDSTVSDNAAQSDGGGLYGTGDVTVVTTTISGNISRRGGGIYSQWTLSLTDTLIFENRATQNGGGLHSCSNVVANGSTISNNIATGHGGGIYVIADVCGPVALTVNDSIVHQNTAGANGGGIYSQNSRIVGSMISGNIAGLDGGGICNTSALGASLIMNNSTITNNAGANGGGIYSGSQLTSGLELVASTLTGVTVSGNSGSNGGGIYNTGTGMITLSTISGNTAGFDGGGVYSSGTAIVSHSTITGNRGDTIGSGFGAGGGIHRFSGTVSLDHTIVAGNLRGTAAIPDDITGTADSLSSFNLVGDPGTAGGLTHGQNGSIIGDGAGNVLAISLILDTELRDNGGPTLTHSLVPGSSAVDTGDPSFDPLAFDPPRLYDQRGLARVCDGRGEGTARIDIGAFEVQPPPGEIRGFKWYDFNGNGGWDAGEPPRPGWTIYLDLNNNGQWDAGEPKTASGADGSYAFTGLTSGMYTVAEEMQNGWEQTYPQTDGNGPSSMIKTSDSSGGRLTLSHELAAGLNTTATGEFVAGLFAETDEDLSDKGPGVMSVMPHSIPLINLDAFRADPRFAGIDGSGFAVVVVDTGMELNHPHFGPDTNGDGVADRVVFDYDFYDEDNDATDFDGHGTHVTGTIASSDSVFTGVAPGVDIIHLKVFHDDRNVDPNTSEAILEKTLQWVVANVAEYNIAAVNMSLGYGNFQTVPTGHALRDELAALAELHVLAIAASGNGFFALDSEPGVACPSADRDVISVGSVWSADFSGPWTWGDGAIDYTTGADRVVSHSQRHSGLTDTLAPGAWITAAHLDGGTKPLGGTSMAAPHVAGAAILAQQVAQHYLGRLLDVREFRALLQTTGVIINDGDDEHDNVVNTGLSFPRLNMLALGEAIVAWASAHVVTLAPGQVVEDVNFGNWRGSPPPTLSIDSVDLEEGDTGTTEFVFTVMLSAPYEHVVTVEYATQDGTATVADGDYQQAAGTLIFEPGETAKQIGVLVNGDGKVENNETFFVFLSNAPEAQIVVATATGTIRNDDAASLSIDSVNLKEGNSGTTAFVFTVTLSDPSSSTVTVDFATEDGTAIVNDGDYQPASGTLTFEPGQTEKTVTVPVNGDEKVEEDETFFVILSYASGASIDQGTGIGTILNDDPTGIDILTVSSVASTRTGFTVQFNRELARSQLNLYDQGGLLGPADVSFMGPGGAEVRGSLVVSPDATSVTFIKTAGLLEPGAYTATLRSGGTAFCDALGMDLDGDGDGVPGGDYVHSFVVDTPETEPVIASLPNVTRGYGQPVNLPADDLTAGLPLTISDGVNVSQVQFQLHYDPALLELQSFTVNAALAGGNATATLTFSAAGIASLSITAPANFAAQPGPLTIGSFTAVVPDDAPYGAKHVLDIADLQVFDAATPAAARTSLDRDAIHVAAFIGDTNGDGWYNSPDATLTRRIIGQINTGFGAYALADPVLFADITGNGIIQSNDTTAIRRAIGLIAVPDIPPLPGKLALSAAADADPGVAINGPNAAAADDESAAWYANDVNKDWLDAPLDALGVIHQRNVKGLSAAEGEARRPIPMLVANSRSVKLVVVEASNGTKRYWDAWGTDLLPLDAVLDDLVDDIAYAWDVEGEASW